MQLKLSFITTGVMVGLGIIYIVYYGLTVSRNNGIGPKFFIFIICLYCCEVIGLTGSSCHYTNKMTTRYGDSFDAVIRRVNQITVALVCGYLSSSGFLASLIILDDYSSEVRLALTTCNQLSLLGPLAIIMYIHVYEVLIFRRQR